MNWDELYAGALLQRPASPASLALVEAAEELLVRHLGSELRRPQPGFFEGLTAARHELKQGRLAPLCRNLLAEQGLPLEPLCIDQLRLRGVAPGSHQLEAARPAFYAHRDTWYANPQAQINLWIPLHRVDERNGFAFYPEAFNRPVHNDSEKFDYDAFRHVGFQQPGGALQAHYPRCLEELHDPPRPVRLERAQLLWFSAAHLHQTLPNQSPEIRFSLDLRIVHRQHHEAGRGAPNCDNRSRGCVLEDYRC